MRVVNCETTFFAPGSDIYHVITGHETFPELCSFNDEGRITQLYSLSQFPTFGQPQRGDIDLECWRGLYTSASEVADKLQKVGAITKIAPATCYFPQVT